MSELTPHQLKACTALLSGKTIPVAAEQAGVTERTVRRWMRESEPFSQALNQGRREALASSMSIVTVAARTAAGVVLEVMTDRKSPPGVRLRAACAILDMLLKWAELQDFEVRLRKLEGTNADIS